MTRAQDRALSVAAYGYLTARAALEGATGPDAFTRAVELDDALHRLTNVAGFAADGCACDDCERLRNEGDPNVDDDDSTRTQLVLDVPDVTVRYE